SSWRKTSRAREATPASGPGMMARTKRWLLNGLGLALSCLALYTAGYGTIEEFYHRGTVILLSAVAVVLLFPTGGGREAASARRLRAVDALLVCAMTASILWFFSVSEELWSGIFVFTPTDIALGFVGMAVIAELTRRALGLPLAILAVLAVAYCLFGQYLPWIFRHA